MNNNTNTNNNSTENYVVQVSKLTFTGRGLSYVSSADTMYSTYSMLSPVVLLLFCCSFQKLSVGGGRGLGDIQGHH